MSDPDSKTVGRTFKKEVEPSWMKLVIGGGPLGRFWDPCLFLFAPDHHQLNRTHLPAIMSLGPRDPEWKLMPWTKTNLYFSEVFCHDNRKLSHLANEVSSFVRETAFEHNWDYLTFAEYL